MYIKGDWPEFCERLGFPTWQSVVRPCFVCSAYGPELIVFASMGSLDSAKELKISITPDIELLMVP